MEQRAIEALQGSIRKWDQIVKGEIPSYGTQNCPLCHIFYGQVVSSEDEECEGCPVREKTGVPNCEETPYEDFVPAAKRERSPVGLIGYWAANKMARTYAAAERDFLISLLPEGTPTGLEEKKSDNSSPQSVSDEIALQSGFYSGGSG